MRGLLGDLRIAARALGRTPGLVVVAALSLAVGMGVNTTLFTAVKAVLFADASAAHPDRLVTVRLQADRTISYPNLQDLRQAGIFDVAAGSQMMPFSVRTGREAERAIGEIVTGNYFDVLGVRAAIGRTFSPAEALPDRDPRVVVLSHGYAQRHFDDASAAIGRSMSVNGQPYTIVGILGQRFRSIEGFGLAPEIYVPASRVLVDTLEKRDGFGLRVVARLKNGRTRQQSQAALVAAARGLARAYPAENRDLARGGAQLFGISAAERLREAGGAAPAMIVAALLAAVSAIVLLIACGNVAGLLLARGTDRRQEIALRLALGASRARIVRQLLAESLLLALLGAACGWVLHLWTPGLLTSFSSRLPVPLPLEFRFEQGLGLLPLELLLAVVAMLLCGLAPALESTRVALVPALKESRPSTVGRRSKRRARSVVWQVSGAMAQMVVALLFLRTLTDVITMNPGFDADRVLNVALTLDDTRFGPARGLEYVRTALQRLAALPGIEAASAAVSVPLSGWINEADVERAGMPGAAIKGAKQNAVSPGYFRTMGIALVRGRDFTAADGARSAGVAIAGETLARDLFANVEPIGQRIRIDGRSVVEIVGVVRDSKYASLGEAAQPLLYRPLVQDWNSVGTVLHVRTAGPPAAIAGAVKQALQGIEKDVPANVRPMKDYIELSLAPIRSGAAILALMGGLGMLLALVGLYGLIAHDVARRTHDFGIRMTLGASPRSVRAAVLKAGLRLIAWGIALGLVLSIVFTRMLAASVVGVRTTDPVSVVVPAILLVVAGLAACYFPARRATRVDPATALRYE